MQNRTDTDNWTAGLRGRTYKAVSGGQRKYFNGQENHGSWVARGVEYLGLQNFFFLVFFNELGRERGCLGVAAAVAP